MLFCDSSWEAAYEDCGDDEEEEGKEGGETIMFIGSFLTD